MARVATHRTVRSTTASEPAGMGCATPTARAGTRADSKPLPIGAWVADGGTCFRVWAPSVSRMELVLEGRSQPSRIDLLPEASGYYAVMVPGLAAGARYRLSPDEKGPFPDPASRAQPDGPHGPSMVVDTRAFGWRHATYAGMTSHPSPSIYELHVGTFTTEGTFDAAIQRLDDLAALGVTHLELMPVAACPGRWNWGYDGVNLFAPAEYYGGPAGMVRFIDAAHERGLAVLLDVVYNHFGPDGNYLGCFSDGYLLRDQKTPWGDALALLGPNARPVREYFIANALYWIHEYRVDGLRLDATHAFLPEGKIPFLRELAERVEHSLAENRQVLIIAEDEQNDARLLRSKARGGVALHGVWADDFHHVVRVSTTGENESYFRDYRGTAAELARTLTRGWLYEGQHRKINGTKRGRSATGLAPRQFIHTLQNHDQVGNRAHGDRLHHRISPAVWRAASALLLISPYTPLIYMGQEWAASTPFQYFTDHNSELGPLVTEGRKREFAQFKAFKDPRSRRAIPDPQAESTFVRSKLRWEERSRPRHAAVLSLYQTLLTLRREFEPIRRTALGARAVGPQAIAFPMEVRGRKLLLVVNLSEHDTLKIRLPARVVTRPPAHSFWQLLISTEAAHFGGHPERVKYSARTGALAIHGAGAVIFTADRPRKSELKRSSSN